MKVCKNIYSGKYFIFLRENGQHLVLITPLGEIKELDPSRFKGPFSRSEKKLVTDRLLSEEQVNKWKTYMQSLQAKSRELSAYLFEGMNRRDLKKFIRDIDEMERMGRSDDDIFLMLEKNHPGLFSRQSKVGRDFDYLANLLIAARGKR